MTYAHVRDRKTGAERKNLTIRAYTLASRKYDLLGYVDEKGNPIEGPSTSRAVAPAQKKSVGPVVVNKLTPEEIEEKKAQLQALNQKSIDDAAKKAEEEKKGPKQKTNA